MTLSVDNSDRDYVDDDDEFEEWFKRNYGKDKEEEPEQEKPEESVVKFTEADVDLAADNASEAVRRMIEAFNNAERSVWGATIEPGRTELGSSLDPDSNKSNDGTVLNNSKKNSSKLTRRRSRSQERKGQGNPDDSSDEDKENAESREDGYSSGSDSFDDNIDTRSAAGKSSSSVPPPAYVNSSGMPTPAGGGTEFSLNIVSSFDIYGMSDESKDADGNKNPFSSKVPMPRRINSEQNSGRAREDSYEDNTEVVSRLLPEHVPKIKSSSSPSTPISRKSAFQRSFSFSEERTKESACITDEERAGQDSVDVNKKILKKSYSEPIQVKMNGYEEPSDSMSSPNESFPVSDGGDGNATHSPNRKKITVEQISTFKRLHRMYSSGEIQNEEEDDKEDDEEDDPGAGSIMDEFNSIGSTLAGWIDRGWRSNRDYKLLRTSLDIENPSLSEKMTRYLLQDYVIEVFISFITLLDRKWTPSKGPCARPKREDPVTDELKRSYRATMLLAHDTPSENLQSIIKAKGDIMVQELLKGFQSNSCANLHHVTHLLSSLLNCIPDVVLHFIGRNKRDGDLYFTFIINNLDNGAVLDFFISLVLAENCVEENVRNAFNYSLSEWGLLQNLQERMVHPEISDELATSISDAISYLVPALTSDPHGAPLLMPLAEPVMIQSLVECATNISCSVERRVASLRVCINVVGMERLRYLEATTPSEMVNNMSDILPIIHKNLQRNFSILRDSICRENDPCASSSSTFSYWRFLIVTLMVEMHTIGEYHILVDLFDSYLWKKLTEMFFQTTEGNMYHGLLCRLFFFAIRSNNEKVQKQIFIHSKFLDKAINTYWIDPKSSYCGAILKCCNVVRLHVDTLPPNVFLTSYLQNHILWLSFLPRLRRESIKQCNFSVSDNDDPHSIDIGSIFAQSMGFTEKVSYASMQKLMQGVKEETETTPKPKLDEIKEELNEVNEELTE